MEPITTATIVAALTTGATLALKKVIEEAAKDAYTVLKNRILEKYGDKGDVQDAVAKIEANPESKARQAFLEEELGLAQAVQDLELVKLTQALIDALKETEKGQKTLGKYNINVQNSEIGNIGDHAHIPGGIHFGETKKR